MVALLPHGIIVMYGIIVTVFRSAVVAVPLSVCPGAGGDVILNHTGGNCGRYIG